MKRIRYFLGFLLIAYVGTGVYQIRPGERAVVRRFGQIVARPGPGLWIGLPWGMDRLDRVSINAVRRVVVGYQPDMEENPSLPVGQILSGDENLVNVQINVDYVLSEEDSALDDYVLNKDRVDAIIVREAESALVEWMGSHSVDEILLIGNAEIPGWIVRRTQERLAGKRLGVRIQQTSVVFLAPPEEVRSAFDDVNRAETRISTQEIRAGQDAEQRIQEARAEAYKLEQQGKSFASRELLLAKADADAFLIRLLSYQELQAQNTDVLTAIWWDEMGRVLLGLKSRGRIDLLDHYLGPDGLDISQMMSPPKSGR